MTDLAKNIKRQRQEKNMTQADLAEALHVTRQTVSSWERSNSTPDLSLLPAIAEALGTDQTGLLYPDEPPKKKTTTVGCSFVLGSAIIYSLSIMLFNFWGACIGLVVYIGVCTTLILDAIAEK